MKLSDIIPRLKGMLSINFGHTIDKAGAHKWYFRMKEHRDDGPAIIEKSGTKYWYTYGELNRANDEPAIEWANGSREWYVEGKRHRDHGPAIERADGTKEWYQNNKLTRDDGPAIERPDGSKEWYRDGVYWPEGNKVTPQVAAEKKEKAIETAVQSATIVDEDVKIMQPIKFKKASDAPSP